MLIEGAVCWVMDERDNHGIFIYLVEDRFKESLVDARRE